MRTYLLPTVEMEKIGKRTPLPQKKKKKRWRESKQWNVYWKILTGLYSCCFFASLCTLHYFPNTYVLVEIDSQEKKKHEEGEKKREKQRCMHFSEQRPYKCFFFSLLFRKWSASEGGNKQTSFLTLWWPTDTLQCKRCSLRSYTFRSTSLPVSLLVLFSLHTWKVLKFCNLREKEVEALYTSTTPGKTTIVCFTRAMRFSKIDL